MSRKKTLSSAIPFIIIGCAFGLVLIRKIQYYQTVAFVKTINSQQVSMFKIYPNVSGQFGTPREIKSPDPLIDDFFESISDIHGYSGRYTVASEQDGWFIEFSFNNRKVQLSCSIPVQKKETIVGWIEYNKYQSRQLYHWYQQYSHRWLTPERTPPAPQP